VRRAAHKGRGGFKRSGRARATPKATDRLLPEPFEIEGLSHEGRGIARWNGKTLFVEGALPGETVTVRLRREQSRHAEGQVVELLSRAPERRAAPCQHYEACGGCQLQHMAPEAQLETKQAGLLEQLARSGLQPRELLPAITSASEGYRHRARLGVWYQEDGPVILGFRRKGRRELTAISDCRVLAPKLNRLLPALQTWLSGLQSRKAISHIEALASGGEAALVLRELTPLSRSDLVTLEALGSEFKCHIWRQTNDHEALLDLAGRPCDPRMSYTLPGFDVRLSFHPGDFVQVNPAINRAMVAQAMNLLDPRPGQTLLDLYCGMGNFSVPMARSGARVMGWEASQTMVDRGRENARANGLDNLDFGCADLARPSARRLKGQLGNPDGVLLDPPREGARQLLPALAQLSPPRLVYVSCNPATLARDAADLAAQGYDLQALGVLDMFPHTQHSESMALFLRS